MTMKNAYLAGGRVLMMTALLVGSIGVADARTPKADDKCFKSVSDKKTSAGRWLVKECMDETDGGLYYVVEFRDTTGVSYVGRAMEQSSDSVVYEGYEYPAANTLSIELRTERGGNAFLLHPIKGTKTLSAIKFQYMTFDEGEGLSFKQTGNAIRAKTPFETIDFTIDEQGRLKKIKTVKLNPKFPGQ
jgi:hypothetical protein